LLRLSLLLLTPVTLASAQAPPKGGAPARLRQAEGLLAAGRHEEAAREAEAATALDPRSVVAWSLLGRARYAQKLWAPALEAFERARSVDPQEPKVWASAGICLFEMQRYEEAEEALRRAAALDPSYGRPHLFLGRIATERGDLARAEEEHRRAAELDAAEPLSHYFLGLLLFKQRRYEEAVSAFERTLRVSPDLPSAHLNLGLALTRLGRDREGREHLERFRSLTEVQLAQDERRLRVATRLQAARVDLEAGRLDSALGFLLEARDLAPEVPAVHALLAAAFDRLGREEEAHGARREAQRLSGPKR
jgi:tetratricopeptide (TPR) repeat protein